MWDVNRFFYRVDSLSLEKKIIINRSTSVCYLCCAVDCWLYDKQKYTHTHTLTQCDKYFESPLKLTGWEWRKTDETKADDENNNINEKFDTLEEHWVRTEVLRVLIPD